MWADDRWNMGVSELADRQAERWLNMHTLNTDTYALHFYLPPPTWPNWTGGSLSRHNSPRPEWPGCHNPLPLTGQTETHTHTQTLVHTWLPSCCSSAWSVERRADECSPGTAQQVKKSRRLDVCGGCVSSPPSAGRVGVFNHHTHSLSRSYTAMQLIQPAGKTNRPWPCTPCIGPQSPTTPLKCVICFFHVVMGVESLNEGMNVAPWRSCPLKTQPGSQ